MSAIGGRAFSVDLREPKTKLLAGASVVVVATLIFLALLPVGRGQLDGGSTARVEAGAPPETEDQSVAGPVISTDVGPLDPLVRTLTVDEASQGQAAKSLESVDALQAGTAESTVSTAESTADGSTSIAPAADGEATTTEVAADAPAETSSETTGAPTTTTEPPAVTTTQAPPTTAAPPPPPAPSGQAPGSNVRTLYVDPSRGSGDNPGTEDKPFRRPIEATSIAQPGTTIYFRGGTYDTAVVGALSIRGSGTAQNWIRITPYPGERVELVSGGEYGSGFEFLGASYVELSGFIIRGRDDSIHGNGVFIKDGAHDIRVIGNQISNFGGGGISLVGGSRVTIEGNDVRNNAFRSHYQGSGISLFKAAGPINSGDAYTNVIRRNYVIGNYNAVPHTRDGRITDGNCIILDRNDEVGYQGRTLIENNVCAENGGRGIHSYRSSNFVARNNTLYHNMWSSEVEYGRGELTAGEARNISFYNNLVINRPGISSFISNDTENTYFHNNRVAAGPPPGEGNVVLPDVGSLFRSTDRGGPVDQWRPLPGSGLTGSANSNRQSSTDYFGTTRPNPGAVGAIEP